MKILKHFCIVYSAPIMLILLVLNIVVNSEKVTEGDILLISLVPMLVCAYFYVLILNPPYQWLGDYYSKNQDDIESFFNKFSKVALVLFPLLYFVVVPAFLQEGYQRVDNDRMTQLDGSHHYRKIDQVSPKGGVAKLKCIDQEINGKKISRCYEVIEAH